MAGYLNLSVYAFNDPKKRLDIIPRRTEPAVLDEIEGAGSGQFTIQKNDLKLTETPNLLDYGNVVKMTRDGVVEGAFVIQNQDDTVISTAEESGKKIVVSGEGLKTWFRSAAVYPAGGLKTTSTDDRVFSWASERGTWYKAADWKTPVVIFNYELQPTGSDSPWTYMPAQWPDAPTARWIWGQRGVKGTTATHPYQVPAGYNYFRYEFETTVAGSYSLFAVADDRLVAYIDSQEILDATGAPAYYSTYRMDFDLNPGKHVIAFRAENYLGPGGLLAAFFRAGDAAAGTAAQLISVTGQAGWTVNPYPAVEPGWSVGEIVLQLLSEAKTRGVKFPSYLTPTFTAATDSAGQPWTLNVPWTFQVGDEYLSVLEAMEDLGCEIQINPDTYELNIWNKRGKDRSVQTTAGQPVVLREGYNLQQAQLKGQADIKNHLLILTSAGWIEADPESSASADKYGRVEGKLESRAGIAASRELAQKTFVQKQQAEEGSTYTLFPTDGSRPYKDFFVGDWVLAPGVGGLTKRRVVSISSSEDSAAGNDVYAVEFDTIFQTREAQLERSIKLLGNGGVSSAMGGSGSTPTKTTAPVGQPSNSKPRPPTNLAATSEGYWNEGGGVESQVTLTWTRPTQNENGSINAGIMYYEVLGMLTGTPGSSLKLLATVTGSALGATVTGLAAGVSWDFYVRAASSAALVSTYSDKALHTTAMPALVLASPTAPTLATALGTVTARWDGNLVPNVKAPVYLSHIYAEYSTAENGTYTVAGATINAEGTVVITSLDVGTQYWVRFVAVDLLGRKSAPSSSAYITVEGFDADELAGEIRDEIDQAKADAATALGRADKAVSDAASANTAAGAAQSKANQASADALAANGLAAGKGKVIFQNTAPTGDNANANNLWVNTTNGANTPNRWDGSKWVVSTDKAATDAAAAAAAAQTKADKAATDAAAAATAAGLAQTSADSKNRIWYQTTAPAGTGHKVGDTWFNTADGNKISRWDGSAWTANLLGSSSIGPGAVAAGNIAQTVNDKIAQGIADAAAAQSTAGAAQTTANSKSRNWPTSTTAPTSGMAANDTWIRSTDGALFRYSGSTWVAVPLATQSYVQSRGLNLVTNGSGLLGDNTNFEAFIFDQSDRPVGASGMFTSAVVQTPGFAAENIPVDPALTYEMTAAVKQLTGTGYFYFAVSPVDADGLLFFPQMYTYLEGSITTLAQPVAQGDTTITLTSGNGWHTGTNAALKYAAVGGYTDGKGYTWPAGTYTRTFPTFASISGNVVTLSAPYTGRPAAAGTAVWNSFAAGSYIYPVVSQPAPTEWTNFSGRIGGITPPGAAATTNLPKPTASVRIGFLVNYPPRTGTSRQAFANVALNEITVAAAAQQAANVAQTTANGKNTVTYGLVAPTVVGTNAGDIYFLRTSTGVITAQYEWTGSAWQIRTLDNATIANLDAGKLTAGTISADRIGANSITAAKLTLGDFTNLLDDPTFLNPLGRSWIISSGPVSLATSTPGSPGRVIVLAANGGTVRVDNGNQIAVTPGSSFYLTIRAVNSTGAQALVVLTGRNEAGTDVWTQLVRIPANSGWSDYTFTTAAAPDTVSYMTFSASIAGSSTGSFQFAKPSVRRRNGGELIVDGGITAAQIAAGSITSSKLLISDATNLLDGSDFENASTNPWDLTNPAINVATDQKRSGSASLKVNPSAAVRISGLVKGTIPVQLGDSYNISLWVYATPDFNGTPGNAKLRIGNQTNALLTDVGFGASQVTPGTWTRFSRDFTVGAGVTAITPTLVFDHTAGSVWLDDITMRRRFGGELIVDGGITAAQIAANEITAAHIKAGTITSTEIATGTITAQSGIIASLDAGVITSGFISSSRIQALSISSDLIAASAITTDKLSSLSVSTDKLTAEAVTAEKIKANSITAVQIQAATITANEVKSGTLTAVVMAANSITTEKLAADAITAKHTITGALIRTAASGARTELTSAGLRVVDTNGVEQIRLGYGIATGMSVRNPRTNALVSLADHVFGAQNTGASGVLTIQTTGTSNTIGGRIIPNNGVVTSTSGRSFVIVSCPVSAGPNSNSTVVLAHYNTTDPQNTTDAVAIQTQTMYADTGNGDRTLTLMGVANWTPGTSRTLGIAINVRGENGHRHTYQFLTGVVLQG